MWTFDQNDKNTLPLLTWESEVHYVYNKAGSYKVSVQASNGIGQTTGSTTITVYGKWTLKPLRVIDILESSVKVMRIKEMIANVRSSWL